MKKIRFVKPTMLAYAIITFTLAACLEDPGNPSLEINKSSVSINEEVTITLVDAANYTCLLWSQLSGPTFVLVSGGGQKDKTMIVKFTEAGSAVIEANVKNCNDGCSGKCRDERTETLITIQ